MSRIRVPRSMAATLGVAFAALILALATPARAQDNRHGPEVQNRPPPAHHDRDWDRRHRPPPPTPVYAEPVYAPPAVVYTAPVPVGGINLIIPFNFR